jgi:hypothetical protein
MSLARQAPPAAQEASDWHGSIGQHVFVVGHRVHIVTRFVGVRARHALWRRSRRRVIHFRIGGWRGKCGAHRHSLRLGSTLKTLDPGRSCGNYNVMPLAGAIVGVVVPVYYLLVWSLSDPQRLAKCLLLKVREPGCHSSFYQLPLTPFSAWFWVLWLLLPFALWIWG